MLEEFKIIDVFEELEPNLTEIKMETLEQFLQEINVQVKYLLLRKTTKKSISQKH